jgi:hypothetical protein
VKTQLGVLVHGRRCAHSIDVGLVLIHQLENAFDELPHRIVGGRLEDGEHSDAALAEENLHRAGVRSVSIKAARVADEDRLHVAIWRHHVRDHLAEPRASVVILMRAEAGFDVLVRNDVTVLRAITSQSVELCRDREVLFSLL